MRESSARSITKKNTLGVYSVTMFCFLFFAKFLFPIGLHSGCSISQTAVGTCQNIYKISGPSGRPTLYPGQFKRLNVISGPANAHDDAGGGPAPHELSPPGLLGLRRRHRPLVLARQCSKSGVRQQQHDPDRVQHAPPAAAGRYLGRR